MYIIPKITECMTEFLNIFFQKSYFTRNVDEII